MAFCFRVNPWDNEIDCSVYVLPNMYANTEGFITALAKPNFTVELYAVVLLLSSCYIIRTYVRTGDGRQNPQNIPKRKKRAETHPKQFCFANRTWVRARAQKINRYLRFVVFFSPPVKNSFRYRFFFFTKRINEHFYRVFQFLIYFFFPFLIRAQ